MRRRTRAAIARWMAPGWFIAAVLCLWRSVHLANIVGDAADATKAGMLFTDEEQAAFRRMDLASQHWFQAMLACIVLFLACILLAIYWNKRRRHRPREHRPPDPYRGLY